MTTWNVFKYIGDLFQKCVDQNRSGNTLKDSESVDRRVYIYIPQKSNSKFVHTGKEKKRTTVKGSTIREFQQVMSHGFFSQSPEL